FVSFYQVTSQKILNSFLDHTSQQYFSDRAGTKTAVAKSHSYGTGGSGGYHRRPLWFVVNFL
ncbi:hypothetical protein, partial [Lentilactobacillus hilgardii]|uniref:hypothetical protein n=1 Tax=Lentilactobacillus hilgardii TaxID=1588 RepID=UPI00390CD7CD